jgi:hypothetical protein
MPRAGLCVWRPRSAMGESHSFLVGSSPSGVTGVIGTVDLEELESRSARPQEPLAAYGGRDEEGERRTVWDLRCAVETSVAMTSVGPVRTRNALHTEAVSICNEFRASLVRQGLKESAVPPRRMAYYFARGTAALETLRRQSEHDDEVRQRARRRLGLPAKEHSPASKDEWDAAVVVEDGELSGDEEDAVPRVILDEDEERAADLDSIIFRGSDGALTVLLVPSAALSHWESASAAPNEGDHSNEPS